MTNKPFLLTLDVLYLVSEAYRERFPWVDVNVHHVLTAVGRGAPAATAPAAIARAVPTRVSSRAARVAGVGARIATGRRCAVVGGRWDASGRRSGATAAGIGPQIVRAAGRRARTGIATWGVELGPHALLPTAGAALGGRRHSMRGDRAKGRAWRRGDWR